MEGSGGPGFVNGDAKIVLSESGTSTTVEVTADVEVGGTIARVGQRTASISDTGRESRTFTLMLLSAAC